MSARGIALPIALVTCLFTLGSPALGAPPTHSGPLEDPIPGFALNRACGTAVDSEGDIYVASAGSSKIEVFDPAGNHLLSIPDSHEPCGLAVDTKGNLYVSNQAAGEVAVVKYHPSAYPFAGTPAYEPPLTIDSSPSAKGIAVDPHDNRLYVAEGDRIATYEADGSFETDIATGQLSGASGVAVFTYVVSAVFEEKSDRHLYVAEAGPDRVQVFSGSVVSLGGETNFATPTLRKTIESVNQDGNSQTPEQALGFGPAGAYLAVDPGNGNAAFKCAEEAGEQACTAGHVLVYDDAHTAVDEFDASGEFLDQFTGGGLTDAKPTAMAIDRSGGPADGTIYLTAGAGSGAKLLTFAPLAPPSRALLPQPPSRVLATASAVTTDSHGDVYVRTGAKIHVYNSSGAEIAVGATGDGIEDGNDARDLAVDSTGKVYVVDAVGGFSDEAEATYYTPSAYPPVAGTTYTRHEPAIATYADFPGGGENPKALAVNPENDRVFLTTTFHIHEYDSAANGSGLLNDHFGDGVAPNGKGSIAVYGADGSVYVGSNPSLVSVISASGAELLAQINGAGGPAGKFAPNPYVAVDQSNGHLLEFDSTTAREYDAGGGFVAEMGGLNESLTYDVATDSACAMHDPPLDEFTTPSCDQFDPANGNTYVASVTPAVEGTNLTAFGPLLYGGPPLAVTGAASGLGTGNATLNGTVNPRGFDLGACRFEYLTDAQYLSNGKTFAGADEAPCVPGLVEIGKGNAPVPVHANVSGLDPEGRYRFRLVAANKFGQSPPDEGGGALFGPPVLTTKTALPVLYTEATLRANIDPSGLPTKYHFEYGSEEGEYEQSTPVESLAGDAGPTEVQATLLGLEEGTEYHFRVVAENEAKVVEGSDQTLVTLKHAPLQNCENTEYRTGLSANLPDCRAYELVTPAETNGFTPLAANVGSSGASDVGFNNWLTPPRGSEAGERLSYFTVGTLPGFDGNGLLDGYRARRGEGEHPKAGWTSELFAPTYRQSVPDFAHIVNQQSVASDQLYSFWRINPSRLSPDPSRVASTCAPPAAPPLRGATPKPSRAISSWSAAAPSAPIHRPQATTSPRAVLTSSSPPKPTWRVKRPQPAPKPFTTARRAMQPPRSSQ